MENVIMLDILKRIKMFLDDDSLDLARELAQLELDNLKGITQERCKNKKYNFYDWYCVYCSNLNCESNKNK